MQTIYWSVVEEEGKHFVMAMVNFHNACASLTIDSIAKKPFMVYPTKEQAVNFVTEGNKPLYYECFGAGYALEYVDPTTEQWKNLIDLCWKTQEIVLDAIMPWYIKLWVKINNLFTKKGA
jgi:hypothetical protein